MSQATRPILRYFGGKWLLAPWIISFFPPHRVYTDTFGGGGSVLLRKSRSYAEIYNDIDGELVNLFTIARDRGEELRAALRLTPFARDEFDLSYDPTDDDLERARRTVIRGLMGFGSNAHAKRTKTGFRANSNRSGTTPARDWQNYPEVMDAIIERLRGVTIENRDALEVMAQHDAETTLHYVDPPYLYDTRSIYSGGAGKYVHELADTLGKPDDKSDLEAHERLAEFLHGLKGMVIISGYDHECYDHLYRDWLKVTQEVQTQHHTVKIEALWISPSAQHPTLFDDLGEG